MARIHLACGPAGRRGLVRFPFWLLLLPALIALLSTPATAAGSDCVRFADHESLNKMFSDGGPGTKVFLCPGKTYRLWGTVVFTAADQELATLGYPSGDQRATLSIDDKDIATAVQGDCRRCARVSVRNLIIDGARTRFGRVGPKATSPGLVVIGGNEGQAIRECHLKDPRGWTAIHVREGSKLQCTGAIIERNEIGPVGEEYDPEVDGPDPELSPRGRPLADGISIACRDSVVSDNTIWDCTDAGIVLYCSPGTVVASNRISTISQSAIGGILMVDATPFDGDYKGLVVRDNKLDAVGRAMRVGVGVGLSILSDDIETLLYGGSVLRNSLTGQYMGFGIAASGLEGWTIKDNWSKARHQGKKSPRCFDDPVNPDPIAFLYNGPTVEKSDIQKEFVDHDFAYVVCIDGLEQKRVIGQPLDWPIKPKPIVAEPEPEQVPLQEPVELEPEEDEMEETGDDALDGILQHSQQRMLESIEALGKRVEDALGAGSSLRSAMADVDENDLDETALKSVTARLEALEKQHTTLQVDVQKLSKSLKALVQEAADLIMHEHDSLLQIQDLFYDGWLEAGHVPADKLAADTTKPPPQAEEGEADDTDDDDDEDNWPLWPVPVVVGVVLVGLWWRVKSKRREHDKIV